MISNTARISPSLPLLLPPHWQVLLQLRQGFRSRVRPGVPVSQALRQLRHHLRRYAGARCLGAVRRRMAGCEVRGGKSEIRQGLRRFLLGDRWRTQRNTGVFRRKVGPAARLHSRRRPLRCRSPAGAALRGHPGGWGFDCIAVGEGEFHSLVRGFQLRGLHSARMRV